MQKLLIIALSASLVVPTAVLAQNGALTSGKPAGVRAAQTKTTTALFTVGILAVGVGVAVAATNCCQSRNTPVPLATSPTTTV